VAKTAFNKKRILLTCILGLNLRMKLGNCGSCSIASYGAETWTLKVDQKNLESYEMRCWRRVEKLIWTDHVKTEVLHTVEAERNILNTINEGRLTGLVTSCIGTVIQNTLLKKR
jgi:hypothetical protein